ncbi:dimethylaniline monooxygenase (N-oxide forming) [Phyllosticta paracitricarpa]|uniref:Dimethylaniline monooxygenase (N-oxide forming) n=2 Tax=Phyllosticta TaxID=121621 RepID=A0ABR1MBR8_9PEZI
MEEFDLVVIGAGWNGLAATKTYIQLHPTENVVVIDSAESIGGVWSQERLYPGLKSNNMLGTYEFSDFPMDEETYGIKTGQHMPGAVLHRYLTDYAERFISKRVRLRTKVDTAEQDESGAWLLRTSCEGEIGTLRTQRLIVATGVTSEPAVPQFQGQESFAAPIFHAKDFRQRDDTLVTCRSVTVVGGAKSAWDAAYAFAEAGIYVDLIIRESGRGPVWMAPPYVTPLKKWLESLLTTRLLTWFSPCIWGDEDGYGLIRWFLHGTWVGRKIVDAFWHILAEDVKALNGYDKHPETKKLKPWNSAFWVASSLSILNYPTDFFELVRCRQIRVHIASITHLSARTVHLSDGQALPADALLCATGWKATPPLTFLPPGSAASLGLPHTTKLASALVEKANATILSLFPRLKSQPPVPHRTEYANTSHPFRLYRLIAPPAHVCSPHHHHHHRTLAFAGMTMTTCTALMAQTQALWISAYFDGALTRVPADAAAATWSALLHSQFGRWRYPLGYGARVPDFAFDVLPYVDMLLRDLGLRTRRKGSWWRDILSPHGVEDYRGLVEEWAEKEGRKVKGV